MTPFAADCFGVLFARWLLLHSKGGLQNNHKNEKEWLSKHRSALTICIRRDPRWHGERLADALVRGAESVDGVTRPVRVRIRV